MCPFSILAFLQPTTVDKEPRNKKSWRFLNFHDFLLSQMLMVKTNGCNKLNYLIFIE